MWKLLGQLQIVNTQPQIYDASGILLYWAAGLGYNTPHEFTATAMDQGPTLAVDYLEIWTNIFSTRYSTRYPMHRRTNSSLTAIRELL